VPTLFPHAAAGWVAKDKWTLPHIRDQYYKARAARSASGGEEATTGAPELLGTCTAGDAIYPEFWGSRVMNASPFHVRGAPPKPKTFDNFADTISNRSEGDVCHLHLPLEQLHGARFSAEICIRGFLLNPTPAGLKRARV
jgi:hypothetical protein